MIQLILDAINSLQEGATLHEDDLPPSLSKDVLEQLKGINKSHYYTTKGNQHQQQQDGDEQSSNESLEKLIRTIIAANGDNNSSGEQKKKHSSSTENCNSILYKALLHIREISCYVETYTIFVFQ